MNTILTRADAIRRITSFVHHEVERQMEFIRKEYKAPKWEVKTKLAFEGKRTTSWGGNKRGVAYISLYLGKYVEFASKDFVSDAKHVANFKEYDSFKDDPVIGSIQGSWQSCVAGWIAHELAHAIQYSFACESAWKVIGVTLFSRGHGDFWKKIYKHLRENLVNGYVFTNEIKILPDPVMNRPRKTVKKSGWTVTVTKLPTKWFKHVYTDAATGKVLGIVASRPKHACRRWDEEAKCWVTVVNESKSSVFKQVEARKIVIGL